MGGGASVVDGGTTADGEVEDTCTGEEVYLGGDGLRRSPQESNLMSSGCMVFPKTSLGSSTVEMSFLDLDFFLVTLLSTKSSSSSSGGGAK